MDRNRPRGCGAWWRFGAAALLLGWPLAWSASAAAGETLEERKLPMHFVWHDRVTLATDDSCGRACRGLVAAVGTVTSETPQAFADFAAGHDLRGATMVLDSSGGSVLDAIALGRQWRTLGLTTTVGVVTEVRDSGEARVGIVADAYCESMCVFLLLSGVSRHVPDAAHVRVHQIWMGDRADDARAASYTAQDIMIIERDIGRLTGYTVEMGGSGDLLALALSVPPWEPLRELTPAELQLTNVVTGAAVAAMRPGASPGQDHAPLPAADSAAAISSTRTAEAGGPTGAARAAPR
ncbi:hypothetical protein [Bradyrhizobium sp. 2TAF24]|uniref:hypothetical protein n=1 Tax=Bradyrhizobium sp. 2TAF24 TaxID=3233011 RepID=UPI003F8DFEEF